MSLRARRAGPGDSATLHAWRNDPVTRAMSRSTAEVPRGDHERWYAAALADPDRRLLVVDGEDGPVGMVRLDRDEPGVWEVSINLAPAARGRGLAGAVLAAGTEQVLHDPALPEPVRVVVAHVRRDNAPSVRLFERAGYRRAGEHDGWLRLEREPNGTPPPPR